MAYLGVRFAAPPVGPLRWQAPQQPACETAVVDAADYGDQCTQVDESSQLVGSEDCLTLNVWVPTEAATQARAVLFFVHGGGNTQGSSSITVGSTRLYSGADLAAATGSIVVTTNYRLGLFGYLTLPALAAEHSGSDSGNYGLRDILAALSWVRENIDEFGGDPSHVLLFGESAGGLNTCLLIASPLGEGLFSSALMESGGCVAQTRTMQESVGADLVAATSCGASDLACLRALDASALINAVPNPVTGLSAALYGPNIDGVVLPEDILTRIAAGRHYRVPVVIGSNADETMRMIPMTLTTEASATAFSRAYLAGFGLSSAQIDAALALYPYSAYATPRAAVVALTTDVRWTCPSRRYAAAFDAGQSEPVWRYFFSHALDGTLAHQLGAYHGIELSFVFGHFDIGGYTASANEVALSAQMMEAWAALARENNPSTAALTWPAWSNGSDLHVVLDTPTTTGDGVRTDKCDGLEAALSL